MGQTLTHGVYLPDEGERNCYSGLAANWQILDTSVGTIAAHTAALAGKAPAVHTHTKSDITDFPAYGTAAGTICEGNDSRLSDARTPVAHTHTKSDVTNLFNSANTWTEHNTYARYIFMKNTIIEIGNAPSSNTSKEISFTDKNNETLSRLVGKTEAGGNSYIFLHATNKYTNGALDPNGSARHSYFYVGLDATGKAYNKHAADTLPDANNTYDLGSSSYQWNNLYAKNYYYNGVAWGLDQANTWSANNTFTGNVTINKNGISPTTRGDVSLSFNELSNYIFFRTRGSSNIKSFNAWLWAGYLNGSAPNRYGRIRLYRASAVYGETGEETPDTSFSFIDVALHYKWVSLTDNVRFINDETANACEPLTNNATDLGTSTNKWKSLNGVNPGALSLPNISGADPIDFSQWNVSGAAWTNYYTPSENGWLRITINDRATNSIYVVNSNDISSSAYGNGSQITGGTGRLVLLMPVRSGVRYQIIIKADSISDVGKAEFIPCNGNV